MAKHTERSPKEEINAVGEVREVALKAGGGGSFKLLLENGDTLTAAFTEREEMIVTNALRLHNNVWLKVKGPGAFDDAGKLKHIKRLEHCQQVPAPASYAKGDSPQEDSQDGEENSSLSTGQSILKIFEKDSQDLAGRNVGTMYLLTSQRIGIITSMAEKDERQGIHENHLCRCQLLDCFDESP